MAIAVDYLDRQPGATVSIICAYAAQRQLVGYPEESHPVRVPWHPRGSIARKAPVGPVTVSAV